MIVEIPSIADVRHEHIDSFFNSAFKDELPTYSVMEDEYGLYVDVLGNFILPPKGFTHFPFRFGKIGGYFSCRGNRLTTLFGAPRIVWGDFTCSSNDLQSLEYFPDYVGGSINVVDNILTDFIGIPPGNKSKRVWCNHNYFPPEAYHHLFELGYDHHLIMQFHSDSSKIDFSIPYRLWQINKIIQ